MMVIPALISSRTICGHRHTGVCCSEPLIAKSDTSISKPSQIGLKCGESTFVYRGCFALLDISSGIMPICGIDNALDFSRQGGGQSLPLHLACEPSSKCTATTMTQREGESRSLFKSKSSWHYRADSAGLFSDFSRIDAPRVLRVAEEAITPSIAAQSARNIDS
jgi:hypothetical protein